MTERTLEKTQTILIADDDEGSLTLLSSWLQKEGYKVISAMDGEEALRRAEIESPDLIFLDIMMPRLDGYSLLLRLKGSDRTHRIPVFIISGQSEKEHKDLCQTFGAMEFIEKPYRIADVANKVSKALN
jgi:CheY-like chemotaxis protein